MQQESSQNNWLKIVSDYKFDDGRTGFAVLLNDSPIDGVIEAKVEAPVDHCIKATITAYPAAIDLIGHHFELIDADTGQQWTNVVEDPDQIAIHTFLRYIANCIKEDRNPAQVMSDVRNFLEFGPRFMSP
jgi:hypothetical protein